MSGLSLVERDFDAFFSVPFHVYGTETPFVSIMRSDLRRILSDKNPLFPRFGQFTFFTARRDGKAVGRIVAHIHEESNRLHGLKLGYFGFFDCANDQDVAKLLLEAAESWVAERGCDKIAGNFNLTAMQQIGVVTEGFEHAPYTDMHYNPAHIPELLEACGYHASFPMQTWETDVPSRMPDTGLGQRQQAAVDSGELRWARVRRRGFWTTLEQIRQLLNGSFANNQMFVPLTREEFKFQAGEMMWIIDHRITQLVYRGDDLVGAVLCIPDLNPFLRSTKSRLGLTTPWQYLQHRRKGTRAVILFLSVKPSRQSEGLCRAMLQRLGVDLSRSGYTHVGGTWVSDENPASLKQVERFASRRLHRLHLFGKLLAR